MFNAKYKKNLVTSDNFTNTSTFLSDHQTFQNVKPACITKPNVRLLQASSFLSHLLSVESSLFYDPNLHKKCTYLTLVNSLCTGCPFHQSQETHKLLASSAGKLHNLNFSRNVICKATMFSHQYNVVSPTISSLFTLCLAGQQNWAVMCLQLYNITVCTFSCPLLSQIKIPNTNSKSSLNDSSVLHFLYAENGFSLLKAVLEEKLNT